MEETKISWSGVYQKKMERENPKFSIWKAPNFASGANEKMFEVFFCCDLN